jgi:hypothetical protein
VAVSIAATLHAMETQSSRQDLMRLQFDDTAAVIEVPDDDDLLDVLRAAVPHWSFREVSHDATQQTVASIKKTAQGYRLDALSREPMDLSAVSAVCGALVEVYEAYIRERPANLCLHCGSVALAGRIVLFPSHSHAGKSTLIGRLAAAGHFIFGDDILPITADDRSGRALGVTPRLRLPLPPAASPSFRAFVESHCGARDARYLFLQLEQRLANAGDTAPLGAIVLLDRRGDGPAHLAAATKSSALKALVMQNFGDAGAPEAMLERLHRLVDRLPTLVLTYSDLEEAVPLLEKTFASWPPDIDLPMADYDPALGLADDLAVQGGGRQLGAACLLSRREGVALREMDGEIFLAGPQEASIFHLNTVGAAVWTLLAQPTNRQEIASLLGIAFPDVSSSRIEADVADVLDALHANGFVGIVEP